MTNQEKKLVRRIWEQHKAVPLAEVEELVLLVTKCKKAGADIGRVVREAKRQSEKVDL